MTNRQKRLLLDVVVIFTLNLLLIALAKDAYADLYKRGAYGPTVTEIQTRLKSWGYYSGTIDGVYGSGTEAAIRRFQQANGLSVDGQAGAKRSTRWACRTAIRPAAMGAVRAVRTPLLRE